MLLLNIHVEVCLFFFWCIRKYIVAVTVKWQNAGTAVDNFIDHRDEYSVIHIAKFLVFFSQERSKR